MAILNQPACNVFAFLTTWKVRMVFTNEDKILVKVLRQGKDYSAKIGFISRQAMIAFINGPTAAEDWRNGFYRDEVRQRHETHCPHERERWHSLNFEEQSKAKVKKMRLHPKLMEPCVTLSTKLTLLWIGLSQDGNFCFLIPVFNYLYFRNRDANFVKNCNTYDNQKQTVNIINSDKSSRSYDDLYLCVTFWDTGSLSQPTVCFIRRLSLFLTVC